uniref:C2H2-type domain-containing protein n=1 Tax=Phlebotomus papatasi TaxID=29031 RepID=A0A1B0DB68_PHLPP
MPRKKKKTNIEKYNEKRRAGLIKPRPPASPLAIFQVDNLVEENSTPEVNNQITDPLLPKDDFKIEDSDEDLNMEESWEELFLHSSKSREKGESKDSVHKENRNYLCTVCGKIFSKSTFLKRHESIHLENRLCVPCGICKKLFTSKDNMRKHMRIVHYDATQREMNHYHRCNICNVGTRGRNAHYEHLKGHPEVTIFKCRFCPKELNSLEAYAQHENIHFVERPYICEICSKSFKQNTHLIRHINMHTLAKKYPCNFCDRIFTQAGNRKIHMKVHTGRPPYECSSCLKYFTKRKEWENHFYTT